MLLKAKQMRTGLHGTQHQCVRYLRPLALRLAMTFCPFTLRFLARNPCFRFRFRCDGWYSVPREPYRTCCTSASIGDAILAIGKDRGVKLGRQGEREVGRVIRAADGGRSIPEMIRDIGGLRLVGPCRILRARCVVKRGIVPVEVQSDLPSPETEHGGHKPSQIFVTVAFSVRRVLLDVRV